MRTTKRARSSSAQSAVKRAPKPAPITFSHLPPEVTRCRILDTAEAAEFCKLSVPHWRRLYRTGKVPRPVRLSARKYGWRIGDLIDFIDARIAPS
jgi:prophage regulatory protein